MSEEKAPNLASIKVNEFHKYKIKRMKALYDYTDEKDWVLSFSKDDTIEVTEQVRDASNLWWSGRLEKNDKLGVFPANYCQIIELVPVPQIKIDRSKVTPFIVRMQEQCFGRSEEQERRRRSVSTPNLSTQAARPAPLAEAKIESSESAPSLLSMKREGTPTSDAANVPPAPPAPSVGTTTSIPSPPDKESAQPPKSTSPNPSAPSAVPLSTSTAKSSVNPPASSPSLEKQQSRRASLTEKPAVPKSEAPSSTTQASKVQNPNMSTSTSVVRVEKAAVNVPPPLLPRQPVPATATQQVSEPKQEEKLSKEQMRDRRASMYVGTEQELEKLRKKLEKEQERRRAAVLKNKELKQDLKRTKSMRLTDPEEIAKEKQDVLTREAKLQEELDAVRKQLEKQQETRVDNDQQKGEAAKLNSALAKLEEKHKLDKEKNRQLSKQLKAKSEECTQLQAQVEQQRKQSEEQAAQLQQLQEQLNSAKKQRWAEVSAPQELKKELEKTLGDLEQERKAREQLQSKVAELQYKNEEEYRRRKKAESKAESQRQEFERLWQLALQSAQQAIPQALQQEVTEFLQKSSKHRSKHGSSKSSRKEEKNTERESEKEKNRSRRHSTRLHSDRSRTQSLSATEFAKSTHHTGTRKQSLGVPSTATASVDPVQPSSASSSSFSSVPRHLQQQQGGGSGSPHKGSASSSASLPPKKS